MSKTAVTIIADPPHSVSPAEHAEIVTATPSNFADIPPVLRLKQENVSIEFDPPVEGLSSEEISKGSLYITESVLAFISSSTGKGFEVRYPSITIHAISRSGSGPGGRPLVFCQLEQLALPGVDTKEKSIAPNGNSEEEEAEGDERDAVADEDLVDCIELKIVPDDPTRIDTIFEALSLCASLHPDPSANLMDQDDEDGVYISNPDNFEVFNGTEDEELSEVGRAALAHLESIIVYPPGVPRPAGTEDDANDGETGEK